jgi:hypothetical protein
MACERERAEAWGSSDGVGNRGHRRRGEVWSWGTRAGGQTVTGGLRLGARMRAGDGDEVVCDPGEGGGFLGFSDRTSPYKNRWCSE